MKPIRIALLCFAVMFLTGSTCVPPKPDPNPGQIPQCPAETTAITEDVCDGVFTQEGLACVNCKNGKGCFNPTLSVYCTTAHCVLDPLCKLSTALDSKKKK